MTQFPFKWPVVGFGPDVGRWSEQLVSFPSAAEFEVCSEGSLQHEARIGMVLVDAAGRSWEIGSVQDLGVAGSFWMQVLRFVFRQVIHRIEVEMIEKGPMPLAQVKARVMAVMDANPDDWCDDEAEAGEAGPPVDGLARLNKLKGRVQRAKTLAGVIKAAEVLVAE